MADKPANRTAGNKQQATEEPMIQLDGKWVPAHEAWAKMEVASEVADAIECFNRKFPNLSTDSTREVVPVVRQRLKDVQLRMPKKPQDAPDLGPVAFDLLARMSPEEAVESIQRDFDQALSLLDLISLAGEADEYRVNAILPEQTAQIWNEMKRPAPGGGLWTGKRVDEILQQAQS